MTDHYDVVINGSGAVRGTPGRGGAGMTGTDAPSRHVGASAWQAAGPGFEVYDPECEAVLGGAARLALVTETDAHEGPVYIPGEDALYFTSLPRKVDIPATGTPGGYIKRLALDGLNFPVDPSRLSVVPARVNMPNGMALGRDGRLVVCEQGTRAKHARISRVDPTIGGAETVVDAWGGLRLNSPNDVAVKGDGTIWFTDPSYGFLQGFRPEPQAGDYVYRYGPSSDRLSVVADGFDKPNGLAFSPDERTLYITDSGANQEPGSYHVRRPHHIVAFDVHDGSHLGAGRLFAVTTPGFPDGIKTDRAGRVYASSAGGVGTGVGRTAADRASWPSALHLARACRADPGPAAAPRERIIGSCPSRARSGGRPGDRGNLSLLFSRTDRAVPDYGVYAGHPAGR